MYVISNLRSFGKVCQTENFCTVGIVEIISFISIYSPKDEFSIELRYAHKKNLNKSGGKNLILETDHPRSLKFDTFLFFEAF